MEQFQTPKARAPQKPPPDAGPLGVVPAQIPGQLRYHRAWACWRYEYDNDRWSKPPYIPDTDPPQKAEPSDAETWRSFEEAYRAYHDAPVSALPGGWDGISFALDERWGIVGVDLDHVSEHRADAERILRDLNSYTERTPGRDGLRVFVRGLLPEGRRRRDWVEMYTRKRFLTVTGQHVTGTPTDVRSSARLYDTWQRFLQQGMR
jgi:primase-polymerase (primpol)-like protein